MIVIAVTKSQDHAGLNVPYDHFRLTLENYLINNFSVQERHEKMRQFLDSRERNKDFINTSNQRWRMYSKQDEKRGLKHPHRYKWYPYGANPNTVSTNPKVELNRNRNYNDLHQGNYTASVIAEQKRKNAMEALNKKQMNLLVYLIKERRFQDNSYHERRKVKSFGKYYWI